MNERVASIVVILFFDRKEYVSYMKLLFISLGCDKNLVDSEFMIGMLTQNGITLTDDETEADIIIVNSCCFINKMRNEVLSFSKGE